MYKIQFSQTLPITLEEAWNFFSNPTNLKKLTPPSLGFEMKDHEEKKTYRGQIISHIVRPFLQIPLTWTSEITQLEEPYYFIDQQVVGPCRFWHHEHRFISIKGGVEVFDIIHYQLPFGLIGKVIHSIKIKKDIEAVFSYRKAKLEEIFGTYSNDLTAEHKSHSDLSMQTQ